MMIDIDLIKQQAFDVDQEQCYRYALQETQRFFFLEEVKNAILDFWQGTVRVLWKCLIDLIFFGIALL